MHRALSRVALLVLPLAPVALLAGCPDPNPTGQFPTTTTGGGAGSGGAPAAGDNPGGGGTAPNSARFTVEEGNAVRLTGTISYEGAVTGRMQLDFLTLGDGGRPMLVNSQQVQGVGKWTAKVPKEFGELYIVAFIDKDGDGPSPTDPAGRTVEPLVIGAEDIKDVELVLSDEPDLGPLTPGGTGALPGSVPTPDGPAPDGPPPDGPPPDGPPPEGNPEGGDAPGGAPPADAAPPPAGDAAGGDPADAQDAEPAQ